MKRLNFYQLTIKRLKELGYSDQCSPCVSSPEICVKPDSHGIAGDPEKAKQWKCPRFCNGLTIVEVPT